MNVCLIDSVRAKQLEILKKAGCENWSHRSFYVRHHQNADGLAFRLVEVFDTPEGHRQKSWGNVGVWRGQTYRELPYASWGAGDGIAEFWDDVATNLDGVPHQRCICDAIRRLVPPFSNGGTPTEMAARAREIKSIAERNGITLDEAARRKQRRARFWWEVRMWFTWDIFWSRMNPFAFVRRLRWRVRRWFA